MENEVIKVSALLQILNQEGIHLAEKILGASDGMIQAAQLLKDLSGVFSGNEQKEQFMNLIGYVGASLGYIAEACGHHEKVLESIKDLSTYAFEQ